jgi:hypothetical protein
MCFGKVLIASLAFAGVLLGAGEAKADYVCSMRYVPVNGTSGSEGYTYASVYTQPDCAGSLVGNYYFCSGGATSSVCTSNTVGRYERHGLLALFQALQQAAIAAQSVTVNVSTCNAGGSGGCAVYAIFSQ